MKKLFTFVLFGLISIGHAYAIPMGGASFAPCVWTGNVAGSCLPSSDTTDLISAPRGLGGIADTMGFNSGTAGAASLNGQVASIGCPGLYNGLTTSSCALTVAIEVCQTPGNHATNTHPWFTEGVFSWQSTGSLQFNSRGDGTTFVNSAPLFQPYLTYESTAGSQSVGFNAYNSLSLMTSLCGSNTSSSFVDGVLGNMPNLASAAINMTSNDILAISMQPAPIPFWPSVDNLIGPTANTASPPSNLTVNLAAGTKIGYGKVSKGIFDIENNGTTINGNASGSGANTAIFWVNPGNNLSCVRLDAGLDPTIENLNCQTAENGALGPDVRYGTMTLSNDVFNNNGCQDGACILGRDHGVYAGGLQGWDGWDGFDNLLVNDSIFSNTEEEGWNLKNRGLNSTYTNSFFGANVNNGAANAHGPMDFPCGGTHSITNSALEANYWSHANANGQRFGGMVQIDEEVVTNTTTLVAGFPVTIPNCHSLTWLPASASFSGTITGINTFTTATNPASVFPTQPFGATGFGYVTDLGASGLLTQGAIPPASWTGPVGGLYTVMVGPCFGGEGTLPKQYGIPIYSCFNATSGSVTLYALDNTTTLSSNTTTTAAISVPANPALFGIAVGDTLFDVTDTPTTVTSITGSGPYTINVSCTPASGNCFTSSNQQIGSIGVVSGTYNSGTGAVSLILGAPTSITSGNTFTLRNAGGTGSVASLNGNYTAIAGTSGTTLNFTAATSLGSITISGGQVTNFFPVLASTVSVIDKNGPIQLVASTTGTGCDGANILCGIANNPQGAFLGYGLMALGTDIASYSCVVAAKLAFVYPSGGSTGNSYAVNDTITLAGGTFSTAAVVKVASVSGGHVTAVMIQSGGIYSGPLPKQFTQASTSGSGTGATFQFGYPLPIIGGSGSNYTITLAQPNGANCISGSTTNQTYNFLMPTSITGSNNLAFWDGPCPNNAVCQLFMTETFNNNPKKPWQLISNSNSIFVSSNDIGGPTWSAGSNGLILGGTDAGGNIYCNKRVDTGTSSRCSFPAFTAASFTGGISGNTMLTVGCGAGCPTVSSGTYNNTTGLVTLTTASSSTILPGNSFNLSGLTGTGSLSSLDGLWYVDRKSVV